jgi:hypothetical protein
LEQVVLFGEVEEEAAGALRKEGDRFDSDGVGTAIVDVLLEHHVLKQHGALIFTVHSLAKERVFFEAIDVLVETLAHRVEGVSELDNLFGTLDLDRFSILASGNGEGRIIELLHGLGNFVGDEEKGGDHKEDREGGAEDDDEEAHLEFVRSKIADPVVGKQDREQRDVAD